MKKYLVLTSVLALAACGGGSGGGSHGGTPVAPENKPFVPVADEIGASNAAITGMVSNSEAQVVTYVKNKLGDDAELVGLGNNARTAKTRGAFVPSSAAGNMDYDKAKELMELAQWLGDDTTTHDDITAMFKKSKTDQNKIKSALKLLNDMYCYVGGDADETARRILERRSAKDFDKPMDEIKQHSEILTLDGVDLYTAPWVNALIKLKFNVNKNGRIESVEYQDVDEYLAAHPGADIAVGPMARDGETAFFVSEDILTKEDMTDDDADGNIVSPEYIKGDITAKHKAEYISYAKKLGLKYSDFGVLQTNYKNSTFNTDALTPEGQKQLREFLDAVGTEVVPFIGGYKDKQIDNARMQEVAQNGEIKFTGLAVASVRVRDENAYNGNGIDIPLTDESMRDNAATLVFDQTGTQTLTADFSKDWYQIQAIKNADGKNSFRIIGGTGGADERFHLDKDKLADNVRDGSEFNVHDMGHPDYDAHNAMLMKTEYYGDNNNPNEAVGLVNYNYTPNEPIRIDDGNGTFHYEYNPDGSIDATIGFGGKR